MKQVRIVEIEDFGKSPCKDPHVRKTGDIGNFKILKWKKPEKTAKESFSQ